MNYYSSSNYFSMDLKQFLKQIFYSCGHGYWSTNWGPNAKNNPLSSTVHKHALSVHLLKSLSESNKSNRPCNFPNLKSHVTKLLFLTSTRHRNACRREGGMRFDPTPFPLARHWLTNDVFLESFVIWIVQSNNVSE